MNGRPVRWITLACMGVESNPTGCADPDPSQHIYDASKSFVTGEDEP